MSSRQLTVSVVVPVLDRPEFLRRALASVAAQTLEDFECIVVDDCSREPLESVVREFDERFVYVRRDENGGPVAARLTGYQRAKGAIVAKLDSDDELLPHTLERAADLLAEHPEVDAVIGLARLDGRLPLRIPSGLHIVDPDEYSRRLPPPVDVCEVFRANVLAEWLAELPPLYKEELAFKLVLGRGHNVLYVDEQWDEHHADAANRLSTNFDDPRWVDDLRTFLAYFRPRIGSQRCAPLDQYLVHRRVLLRRLGHRDEAELVSDWLAERGTGPLRQARILLRTRRERRKYRF